MPLRSAYSSIQLSAARASYSSSRTSFRVAGPALVLVEQHHVERRRVGAAVVGRVRPLLEGGHLPVAHLVEDPARVLVAEVVDAAPLPVPERAQGRRRQLRRERQRLQAGEDAVAAEHGHEPRQAGGRQAPPSGDRRREAQGGEVDEAAPVRRLERLPVALESRRLREPALQVSAPCSAAPASLRARTSAVVRPARSGCGDDVQVGRPAAVGLDARRGRSGRSCRSGRSRRGDRRLASERLALVAEQQPPSLDPRGVRALLRERVLDLEEVGEVAARVDADRRGRRASRRG